MQSATGSDGGGGTVTDTSVLEAEVRNTVARGSNVQKDVHDLTVTALGIKAGFGGSREACAQIFE
jgi:hypothetical protein